MHQLVRRIRDSKVTGERKAFEHLQNAIMRNGFRVKEKAVSGKTQNAHLRDESPLRVRKCGAHPRVLRESLDVVSDKAIQELHGLRTADFDAPARREIYQAGAALAHCLILLCHV